MSPDSPVSTSSKKSTAGASPRIKGFASLVAMAALPLSGSIVMAILSAALSLAPCWLIYHISAEALSAQPDTGKIHAYAGIACGLLLLRWVLMAGSHVLAHYGAFTVQHRLRLALARHLGQVSLSFFSHRGTGSLRRTMTDDVNSLEGFLAHMLPDAVAAATVPVAALILLAIADWRLTLAALLPLPFAVAAQTLMMRRTAGRLGQWNLLQTRIANQVSEFLRGMHVIKSFSQDARSFRELSESVHQGTAWVAHYAGSSSLGWVLFSTLLTANLVVVAPLGAWLYLNGSLDLPTYLLFLLVAPAVLLPLKRLTFAIGEQMQRAGALARINDILESPPLTEPEPPAAGAAIDIQARAALDVAFIGISHRYSDRQTLNNVSFRAPANGLTAIVGASGSGKSTLLRLVPRFYELQSGCIQVGGRNVLDWPLDSLLDQLGIVLQDVVLFHGSVRENLRIANPRAQDAEIEAAAQAACAHDFIMALPQGYDTQVGERGVLLSGGERQRLSIARALLKNAPILLLDEPTASVDVESETLIHQALSTLCRGRTVLMIAHRLHTVINADQIVVLDEGRIVGRGTHRQLLIHCPVYQGLWQAHERACRWSLRPTSMMSSS